MIKRAVNVFWFAFLADGLLSFLDEIFQAKTGDSPINFLRAGVALLVLVMSFFMAGLVIFSRQAPKRVLVPMVLFAWWANLCGIFPLGNWNVVEQGFWLDCAQLILAIGILVLYRAEGSGLSEPFNIKERDFSWKRLIFSGVGLGAAFAAIMLMAVFTGLARKIEKGTGGYVRLKVDGIYMVERKFQQGNREVWLAGMVHIARREFYSDVLPKADPALPSIVLVEGVSDRKSLLGKDKLRYAHLAKMLHMTAQEDSEYTNEVVGGLRKEISEGREPKEKQLVRRGADGIDFKRADVDVESFDPKTTAYIVAVMSLFQCESLGEVLNILRDPKSPINDKESEKQLLKDILVARNDNLVAEIDTSLKDYRRVIVPWGAFHLSGIQSWLLAHDFVQEGEVERKAVAFW